MVNNYFFRFVAIVMVTGLLGLNNVLAEASSVGIQLPAKLTQSIKASYPSFRIVRRNEVNETDCAKTNDNSPMVVEGDFNGDQIADFAVLLISSTGKEIPEESDWGPLYKLNLVVYLGAKNGSFEPVKLTEMNAHLPIGFETRILKKGRVYDLARESLDGKSFLVIHIKHPGITVERCGGGSVSYYWDGKEFQEIGTGQ